MTNTTDTIRLSTRLVLRTFDDGSYLVGRLTGDQDYCNSEDQTDLLDNVVRFDARGRRVPASDCIESLSSKLVALDLDSLEAAEYVHALDEEAWSIEEARYHLDQREAHLAKARHDFS
jgi:hypothetical protein